MTFDLVLRSREELYDYRIWRRLFRPTLSPELVGRTRDRTAAGHAEQRKGVSFIVITETLNLKDYKLQKKMATVIQEYRDRIERILAEGMAMGELRKDLDAASASLVFFGIAQSLVTLWALRGDHMSVKRSRTYMFDIFRRGTAFSHPSSC